MPIVEPDVLCDVLCEYPFLVCGSVPGVGVHADSCEVLCMCMFPVCASLCSWCVGVFSWYVCSWCVCVPGVVQMPIVVSDVLCECVFLMCMSACSWCECECIPGVCECVFLVCRVYVPSVCECVSGV